jgi:hypothetical protein
MLLSLAMTALLSAAPVANVPSVAVPPFRGSGVGEQQLTVYANHLAQEFVNAGAKVTTSAEIATLLGLERQRQLMGCTDQSESCLQELAGALGTDYTLIGDVSRVDADWKVSVSVIRSSGIEKAGTYVETARTEAGVLRALSRAGWRLGSVLLARAGQLPVGTPPEAVVSGDPPPGRGLAWVPLAAGAVCLAGGTFMVARAMDDYAQLNPRTPISLTDAAGYRDEGKLLMPLGVSALAVGAAAVATSGMMYFMGGGQPSRVQLSMAATPQGGAVAVRGLFP